MRHAGLCAAALILAAWSFSGYAPAEPSGVETADQLFKSGKFAEARDIYVRIQSQNPEDYAAVVQLGHIALLSNRLDEARKWLTAARDLRPGEADPKVMLAEAFYRGDDFAQAASSLDGVDMDTNQLVLEQYPTLNVAKLESFKGETPYALRGEGDSVRLEFVGTGPLPVVTVRVNGSGDVTFFIDTGGSEIALDTDFAKELGLPDFGKVKGTFSGGQQADVGQSRVDSIALGAWTVTNLPAVTLPLRQLSKGLGVKRVDGCIGTTLLYHFLATLDFPNGELVLRRKTADGRKQFAAEASGMSVAVPFWIASDHFMVGWGRVKSLPPTLLFVDTGLAGAGVKLADPIIKKAGITLEEDKATEGQGGGGTLKIVPYTVSRLSLGRIEEQNVPGLYDGPFPWETTFGFELAGMVGHDFFKPYAVTFDFDAMQIVLRQP